jgi:hypothetical protein
MLLAILALPWTEQPLTAQEYCEPQILQQSSWSNCGYVKIDVDFVDGACLVSSNQPTTNLTIRITWTGLGCGAYNYSLFQGFRSLKKVPFEWEPPGTPTETIASGIVVPYTPVQGIFLTHQQTYELDFGKYELYVWGDTDQGDSAGAVLKLSFVVDLVLGIPR